MWQSLLNGIIMGSVLALLIGPVFFALLQTSIQKGFRAGALMATGVLFSDFLYILFCYLGLASLAESDLFRQLTGIIGGGIMIIFGILALVKPQPQQAASTTDVGAQLSPFRLMLKAFVLNTINPFSIVFWLAVVSKVFATEGEQETSKHLLFFVGLLSTAFGTDLLKVYSAKKLRAFITPRLLKMINIIVGLALMGFGLRAVYYGLSNKEIL